MHGPGSRNSKKDAEEVWREKTDTSLKESDQQFNLPVLDIGELGQLSGEPGIQRQFKCSPRHLHKIVIGQKSMETNINLSTENVITKHDRHFYFFSSALFPRMSKEHFMTFAMASHKRIRDS